MKRLAAFLPTALLLLACNFVTRALNPAATPPPAPPTRPAGAAESPPTPPPTTAASVLDLQRIDPLPDDCSESPFGLPAEKMIEVAYVPSGFCFNGEIDLFETNGRLYVVQSLGEEAAFFIADATDPARPFVVGAWQWNNFTYTADVKAFRQGGRQYLVLSMEPMIKLCGVAIVEVTDPADPHLLGNFTGDNTGAPEPWCDSHTTEIGRDQNGDGAFIYVSSMETSDLRLLDIRDLANVREVNHYAHPDADFDNFVHDTTLAGDKVYVAYWSAGAIILDRNRFEAGEDIEPLNPPGSIAPEGLQIHHSYPTADGSFLFVEDEVNYDGETSQLRLYDIRDLSAPKEALQIKLDSPYSSPHNLLVVDDLLFVGWYSDGVRVFKYDVSDPDNPKVEPYAFKATRPEKTIGVFGSDIYDSIYGVRLHDCAVDGSPMTCIYASDLTRGLLILAMEK